MPCRDSPEGQNNPKQLSTHRKPINLWWNSKPHHFLIPKGACKGGEAVRPPLGTHTVKSGSQAGRKVRGTPQKGKAPTQPSAEQNTRGAGMQAEMNSFVGQRAVNKWSIIQPWKKELSPFYGYTLQCEGTSKTSCQVKEASHKRLYPVWFYLHKVSRIGKFTETESRLVVARDWKNWDETWRACQWVWSFSLRVMKRF